MERLCRYHAVGADDLTNLSHNSLNSIEFIQVFSDNGNVLVGSKILPMLYGAIYIIDASEPHCTAPLEPQKYERNLISFNKSNFVEILKLADCLSVYEELFTTGSMCIKLPNVKMNEADNIFKELYKLISIDTLLEHSSILKFSLLIREHNQPVLPQNLGIVSQAIEYIDQNLDGDLSTSSIAHSINVSKYHLCHSFRIKTGMCLTDYVREKRLKESERLLLKTSHNVSEISEKLGYSSTAYFCKLFKGRYGCSPIKYRLNICNNK